MSFTITHIPSHDAKDIKQIHNVPSKELALKIITAMTVYINHDSFFYAQIGSDDHGYYYKCDCDGCEEIPVQDYPGELY